MRSITTLLLTALFATAPGCGEEIDETGQGSVGTDTDADADTDGDTDGDTDADSDSDSDSDSVGDTGTETGSDTGECVGDCAGKCAGADDGCGLQCMESDCPGVCCEATCCEAGDSCIGDLGDECCTPDCSSAECGDDGCEGSCGDCVTPPDDWCADADTVTHHDGSSTCDLGSCNYGTIDYDCPLQCGLNVSAIPACVGTNPTGNLDSATTADGMAGWTCDQDTPWENIGVHFYFDAPVGDVGAIFGGGIVTSAASETAVNDICGGGSTHRFVFVPDDTMLATLGAGTTHDVYAYGINTNYNPDGDPPEWNVVLSGCPKQYTVPTK